MTGTSHAPWPRPCGRMGSKSRSTTARRGERGSRVHDDVLLVLRGLNEVVPRRPGRPTCSGSSRHPELVTPWEAARYDAVFAASTSWAAERVQARGGCRSPAAAVHRSRAVPPRPRTGRTAGRRVLFVGNSRKVFRPIVQHAVAAGAELAVYGGGWDAFLDPTWSRGAERTEQRGRGALRRRRARAQRPLGRHAAGRVPVQPAVRRRGLRGAGGLRRRARARGDLRGLGGGVELARRDGPAAAGAVPRPASPTTTTGRGRAGGAHRALVRPPRRAAARAARSRWRAPCRPSTGPPAGRCAVAETGGRGGYASRSVPTTRVTAPSAPGHQRQAWRRARHDGCRGARVGGDVARRLSAARHEGHTHGVAAGGDPVESDRAVEALRGGGHDLVVATLGIAGACRPRA